jgi:serine/threonine protein kinase
MEMADGPSLAQPIQKFGTAGMLDWQTTVRVAVHVACALEFAFEHNIIHRNLTPRNILFRTHDQVALLETVSKPPLGDLMLAKRPDDRFQTPSALLKDLERIGKYLGVTVPP